MFSGTIEEVAEQAERILKSVAPTACCAAQEWDGRIDCLIRLPNGRVAGEMISLDSLSEDRIREAGKRLQQRLLGLDVPLVNELWEPIRIVPTKK